ncbi:tyrosine-protein kinase receptor UFO [Chelonoidis abingdonii]|uniref:tyrosine-protein kinase receptor UFO n=1 Tax=Chelonoidis abingdonii TaxID=106734 RepID=UPI003F495FF5
MGKACRSLLCVLVACWMGTGAAQSDLHFLENPSNQTSSLGKDVRLRCAVQLSQELPEISWLRDGQVLELADSNQVQMPINEKVWLAISELSIPSVQLSDAGSYQCIMWVNGEEVLSDAAHLGLEGLNRSASFSCEAHNAKGVATSRTAAITVVPQRPRSLVLVTRSANALEVGWEPGASGASPLSVCTVQAVRTDQDLSTVPPEAMYNQNLNVPPFHHLIQGLAPFASYHVRVACRSEAGASRWTHWVPMETLEGAPCAPPENVTAFQNGSRATVHWLEPRGPLGGILRGYRLAYQSPGSPEVVVDVGLTTEKTLELVSEVQNLMVRVASYTSAGDGPWSDAVVVSPSREEAFEPRVEQGELVVHYRVRKSYSRRTTEATLNSLGISEDLKEKLRDVMVDRHKVALGKTLGEGEFGSVMEGQLNQDDSILKVAVKTMKIAICTRSEMEDFLSEAVCMKEFDHPNVMKLLGVCLQSTESEGYPSPVVILPFMKHGDLHSFLLYSRLGDSPLPVSDVMREESARAPEWAGATRGLGASRHGSRGGEGKYQLMTSCWALHPKERPSFQELHGALEKTLRSLPAAQGPDEILYVNMEDGGAEQGAVGGPGPELPAKGQLLPKGAVAAQVHRAEGAGRYVLCPAPPESSRRPGDPPTSPTPCTASEEGA